MKLYAIIAICGLIGLTPRIGFAKLIRTTSYCAQEDHHFLNCRGERLQVGDCAADFDYYPYGTRLSIMGRIYTVHDCGSAVVGPNHVDIFCPSLKAMYVRGTIYTDVRVQQRSQREQVCRHDVRRETMRPERFNILPQCVYNSKRSVGYRLRLDNLLASN
jgi:3D (Asp-Asp-Asp) domain-containing protein